MGRIAVLMSTYNGERFLREQIESILRQTCELPIDLWVRDDGSTDDTKVILSEYASQAKLNWYTGRNLGPAHSFLDLIFCCAGYDYYAFADQDDHWMPDKLARAVQGIKAIEGPALYCSNAELVDEDLTPLHRMVYHQKPNVDFYTLLCAGGLLGCTMVFNKKLAQFIQSYARPEYVFMHDFYVAALCAAVNGEIFYDEAAHIQYRQHQNNVFGVPHSLLQVIKRRMSNITTRGTISIAEQAETLLWTYGNDTTEEKRKWLNRIAHYRTSFFSRLSLAVSSKTKYINVKMGLTLRLAILLGNR